MDRKIEYILRNSEEKRELANQGVYEITCGDCHKTDIEQTNRIINAKMSIKVAVRNNITKSSLAQYVGETRHTVDFENTKKIGAATKTTTQVI